MTDETAWKLVRGDTIVDDHVFWFHRTFRERATDSAIRLKRSGRRSRDREIGSDGTGENNSKAIEGDRDLVIYALAIWCAGQASNPTRAAFMATMLRKWPHLPPTMATLTKQSETAAQWHLHDEVLKRSRRIADQLRFANVRDRKAGACLRKILKGHVDWTRKNAQKEVADRLPYFLANAQNRGPVEDQEAINARYAPRDIESEIQLADEAKSWA